MTGKVIPFNPLDKQNLGASVAEALLSKDAHPLEELTSFQGAGIYAIYYTGDHPAYRQLAELNRDGQFRLLSTWVRPSQQGREWGLPTLIRLVTFCLGA